mmetsp:Transcript_46971/g.96043  ORF Transcript_46971/g.96043 Transcript_46971/m.96043 type:complete len:189 (+) Transcript_46971:3879-4445(+)
MSNLLKNTWTFWYDKPDPKMSTENWDQFLIRVGTFQTVESLWGLLNNIVSLTNLPSGANLHLFKKGIEPKWEDFQNKKGGKWVLEIHKSENLKFNKIWRKTILFVLGTELSDLETNSVNGVVLSAKKEQYRIAIWTKDSSNRSIQISIGEKWTKIVQEENFFSPILLEYISHRSLVQKRLEKKPFIRF